jgi:LAG1, DNA binding
MTVSMNANVNHFDRPILQRYLETRNRIGFGERTVIVMASKVAQKSYGQERRYVNEFQFNFKTVADCLTFFMGLVFCLWKRALHRNAVSPSIDSYVPLPPQS